MSRPDEPHPPPDPVRHDEIVAALHVVVELLFRTGLSLDAVQQGAESDYVRTRAAAAAASLDEAVRELRAIAAALLDPSP